MGERKSTLALIADLIKSHKTDAATRLSEVAAEMDEARPEMEALRYELRWLIGHLRDEAVRPDKKIREGAEDEEIVTWKRVIDGKAEGYVVRMCPRLESLMKGELPSLRAFKEGRRP